MTVEEFLNRKFAISAKTQIKYSQILKRLSDDEKNKLNMELRYK